MAVVIPCYQVKGQVARVIKGIGKEVGKIYCVDDACPEGSGKHIQKTVKDRRVKVLFHKENKGVGGAMKTGYKAALKDNMEIMVKVDGDGQMDPALIPQVLHPILLGHADYVKGNRFYNLEDLHAMPRIRLVGNAGLSFLTKLSSGYWNIYDPTNGYTAVHAHALRTMALDKVADGYFFESDFLFRLNTIGAVVQDFPMAAVYGDEVSGLRIRSSIFRFFFHNMKNFAKRLFYNYYLRDFNIASLELMVALPLLLFGILFGLAEWLSSIRTGIPVTSGTVMLSALPIILGVQLTLAFLAYDTRQQPTHPLFVRHFKPRIPG